MVQQTMSMSNKPCVKHCATWQKNKLTSQNTTTCTFMVSDLEENTDKTGNGNLVQQVLECGGKWKTSVLAF